MSKRQTLLVVVIMPYLFMYAIVGRQEVPEYSPAQWWPAAQDALFVLGVLIIMGMAVWKQIESMWIMRQRNKLAKMWREFRWNR